MMISYSRVPGDSSSWSPFGRLVAMATMKSSFSKIQGRKHEIGTEDR